MKVQGGNFMLNGFIYAKTDFGPPPPGYVPGLGRGAVGFITGNDVGDAIKGGGGDDNLNDNQYDNWNGYQGSLFNNGEYDDEDKQADKLYDFIEDRMDERRKQRRERKLQEELSKLQKEKPTISQQFSDLKRNLGGISHDEWEGIPDATDRSIKKVKKERIVPVPDSLIESSRKDMEMSNSINVAEGTQSSMMGNLNDIGTARGTILASKLDKQSEQVDGIRTVDKKGILTELSSVKQISEAEVGDYDRVRKIIKSLINSNPKNPEGWISAARIEELQGKIQNAKNLLHQGLKHCETSQDLWLETVRLEAPDVKKPLIAKAVQILPSSERIWMEAVKLESEVKIKKRILKKALEIIPNNPRLWQELIELEKDDDEARELLRTAVECVPANVDMWLALAKLETYQKAREVLNRARNILPMEASFWIAAAKLEESVGKDQQLIDKVILKGIKVLQQNKAQVNRDDWIEEAQYAERSENTFVCKAIVKSICFEGLLEANKVQNILEDLRKLQEAKSYVTLRAMYSYAIDNIEYNKQLIQAALDFEIGLDKEGQENELIEIINKSVELHPQDEELWIECIKSLWNKKEEVKKLIERAIEAMPQNENILLYASKKEREEGNIEKAREYLQRSNTEITPSSKTLKHLLKFELRFGSIEKALEYAQTAMKLFMKEDRLVVLASQVYKQAQGVESARKILKQGLEVNKNSLNLWRESVLLEISIKNYVGARPILEKAKIKLPKNAELYKLAVRIELESGNKQAALYILARALKELPNEGELWSLRIELEPKVTRKKVQNDAIKQCDKDPYVYLSVAKIFWKERKFDKVRRWLEMSKKIGKDNADVYLYNYHFEMQQENYANAREIRQKLENFKFNSGSLWKKIKKTSLGWNKTLEENLETAEKLIDEDLYRIE